eukprot:5770827-Pyramimonas_sp.AAC.1
MPLSSLRRSFGRTLSGANGSNATRLHKHIAVTFNVVSLLNCLGSNGARSRGRQRGGLVYGVTRAASLS